MNIELSHLQRIILAELEEHAVITILPCALMDDRPVLKFSIALAGNGNTETFDYSMGTGHIDLTKGRVGPSSNLFRKNRYATPTDKVAWLAYVQACQERQQVKPALSEVLDCLFAEASACGDSFENWCGDYGYDSDSRKALQIYHACQRNGDKLRRVLGSDYDELEEIGRENNDK